MVLYRYFRLDECIRSTPYEMQPAGGLYKLCAKQCCMLNDSYKSYLMLYIILMLCFTKVFTRYVCVYGAQRMFGFAHSIYGYIVGNVQLNAIHNRGGADRNDHRS